MSGLRRRWLLLGVFRGVLLGQFACQKAFLQARRLLEMRKRHKKLELRVRLTNATEYRTLLACRVRHGIRASVKSSCIASPHGRPSSQDSSSRCFPARAGALCRNRGTLALRRPDDNYRSSAWDSLLCNACFLPGYFWAFNSLFSCFVRKKTSITGMNSVQIRPAVKPPLYSRNPPWVNGTLVTRP